MPNVADDLPIAVAIAPDPAIAPYAAVLTVRLPEYWIAYRPGMDEPTMTSLMVECARRVDSLAHEGLNGPYVWRQIEDGHVRACLMDVWTDDPRR